VTSPGPLRERGSIRVAAASTNSANNLKQMSLAAFVYETAHRSLPPGYTADQWGQPLHGWQTHLLPYLDRDNVYARIQLDRPWDDPANRAAFSTDIREYRSLVSGSETDSSGYCLTHYAGNSHLLTPNKSLSVGRIKDGPSNTILYGEVAAGFRPWGHPLNLRDPSKGIRKSADAFAGPWSSGVTQFAFADGSVRSIRNDISPSVLIALATPAGREEVSGIDW
jgi:hypothetical protein